MAKKAASHLCLLSLYRTFWLEMPAPQSLSSHQENHTLQAATVQHKPPIAATSLTTATCLYTSFSFSFHPSKKVCINFLACQVLVEKKSLHCLGKSTNMVLNYGLYKQLQVLCDGRHEAILCSQDLIMQNGISAICSNKC